MRVRASHAEAERPRLFPLSQGQYVCEIRSRTFPQLGQLSAAQQGLSQLYLVVRLWTTMDPESGSMVDNWFLDSGRQKQKLTAVLTGFWTPEANLKKQMVFVRSKELEHIAGVRTDCSPF